MLHSQADYGCRRIRRLQADPAKFCSILLWHLFIHRQRDGCKVGQKVRVSTTKGTLLSVPLVLPWYRSEV